MKEIRKKARHGEPLTDQEQGRLCLGCVGAGDAWWGPDGVHCKRRKCKYRSSRASRYFRERKFEIGKGERGEMREAPHLKPGYIFSTKGHGIAGWLSRNLIKPKSARYHYGLVCVFVDWERGGKGDYVARESIGSKGVADGRLFANYIDRGYDVEIYEVVGATELEGRMACAELSRMGRRKYDYALWLKIALGVITCWIRQIRRFELPGAVWFWEIPYTRDVPLICTEAAAEGWRRAGKPIIPEGVCPLPASFEQALREEVLNVVAKYNRGYGK